MLRPSASVCNNSAMLLQMHTYNRSHDAPWSPKDLQRYSYLGSKSFSGSADGTAVAICNCQDSSMLLLLGNGWNLLNNVPGFSSCQACPWAGDDRAGHPGAEAAYTGNVQSRQEAVEEASCVGVTRATCVHWRVFPPEGRNGLQMQGQHLQRTWCLMPSQDSSVGFH